MEQNKIDPVLKDAINHYGESAQILKCIEELSELTKVIAKYKNINRDSTERFIDEISDVYIMLEQLKYMRNIHQEDINNRVKFKLTRLKDRIEKEKGQSSIMIKIDQKLQGEYDV